MLLFQQEKTSNTTRDLIAYLHCDMVRFLNDFCQFYIISFPPNLKIQGYGSYIAVFFSLSLRGYSSQGFNHSYAVSALRMCVPKLSTPICEIIELPLL